MITDGFLVTAGNYRSIFPENYIITILLMVILMLVWDFCAGDTQGCTNIGEVTRFPEDGRSHSTGYKGVLVSLGDEWSGLTLL
jgi:hypothetical protein